MHDANERKPGRATQKMWVRTWMGRERHAQQPRQRRWEWAATTADEKRIAALSERFNRSRQRDLGPAIAVVTGLFGLFFVAIGVAVLAVLAGGSGAISTLERTAGHALQLLAERANADGTLWALYAALVALSVWLLYHFRRALYLIWVALLVGLFALGVAGSMAIAHQFAQRTAGGSRAAAPLGIEDLERGTEVLNDKAEHALKRVQSTLGGSTRRPSSAGHGPTDAGRSKQVEAAGQKRRSTAD